MFQDAQEEYEDISAYNNDPADIDLDGLSQQLLQPQPKSHTGHATFKILITLVAVILVAMWVMGRMGVL